jgi:DNA-binding MarR family transcriptional regulator
VVKLADIVGYRLDMARCAALRGIHRLLDDTSYRPADTTALLLVKERPGCDQTELGRALAANRSVGMKVATRLEAKGLLIRGEGRNRRSKGLHITEQGEAVLADLLARHDEAEVRLTALLEPGERKLLLALLEKVERAILEEEADPAPSASAPRAGNKTGDRGTS